MTTTVDVALESLELPEEQRFDYIQQQMTLLIGRPVHRDEVLSALEKAKSIARLGGRA